MWDVQVEEATTVCMTMPSGTAEETARLTPTATAFAMMWTPAWAPSMLAAFATGRARFTIAAVKDMPMELAIAMATRKTLWGSVAETARLTPTATAFATM